MSEMPTALRVHAETVPADAGEWAQTAAKLMRLAAEEIKRLNALAGAVSVGNGDFRTVKALLPHAGTSFATPAYTGACVHGVTQGACEQCHTIEVQKRARSEWASRRLNPVAPEDDKPNTGC